MKLVYVIWCIAMSALPGVGRVSAAESVLTECPSHGGDYSVVFIGNGEGGRAVAFRHKGDRKNVATVLPFKEGIRVDVLDARWSPKDDAVVVLLERRQTFELMAYRKRLDGGFEEISIPLPDFDALYGFGNAETDLSRGESSALGAFKGNSCAVLYEAAKVAKSDGDDVRKHYVVTFILTFEGRRCSVENLHKMGALNDAKLKKAKEKFTSPEARK